MGDMVEKAKKAAVVARHPMNRGLGSSQKPIAKGTGKGRDDWKLQARVWKEGEMAKEMGREEEEKRKKCCKPGYGKREKWLRRWLGKRLRRKLGQVRDAQRTAALGNCATICIQLKKYLLRRKLSQRRQTH